MRPRLLKPFRTQVSLYRRVETLTYSRSAGSSADAPEAAVDAVWLHGVNIEARRYKWIARRKRNLVANVLN